MSISLRRLFAQWLEEQIAAGPTGTRLPAHRALAREWDLSETTIRAVIRRYARRRQLVCLPGKGTFIGAPSRPAPASPPQSSVESLVSALTRALSRGELKRGDALPPVKVVCLQFHVTPATVASAYRELESAGLATRIGRRYWVGGLTGAPLRTKRDRVLFFYDSTEGVGAYLAGCLWREGLLEMENELHSCGFRLAFEPLDTLHSWWERKRDGSGGVHGIVVASESADRMTNESAWLGPFLDKRTVGLPRIAFAGARAAHLDRRLHHFAHGHIQTVRAREVARFCARYRFRSIHVFIDSIAGRASDVRDTLRLIPEIGAYAGDTSLRFVLPALSGVADGAAFVGALGRKHHVEYLRAIAGDGGVEALEHVAGMVEIVQSLAQALARSRDGTLWYFLRAETAAQAVRWCTEHGRKPAQQSVLSATNAPACYELGISSCVTDWRTIGYLLAHALIGDMPVERTRRGYIRTRARIYERLTAP